MKFGLVGTGFWARSVHAAALQKAEDVELAGVWGRDPAKAAAIADEAGATPYADVDAMIDAVDAVAFAVPPDVQVEIAIRAAQAGRHLLLEKPVATRVDDVEHLVDAVEASGVSSLVMFTGRFCPEIRAWISEMDTGTWHGGSAMWLGGAFASDSPFRDSPWRRDKGALWDVGPHVLAMITATLGPIHRVTADAGAADLVHLVAHHENGATSTATMTLGAPSAAVGAALTLWGEPGTAVMPPATTGPAEACAIAVTELVEAGHAGRTDHPCDVRFGAHVVRLLADAQRQLDDNRARPLTH